MQMPNVVTTLKIKEKNFIFHVQAYRRLSESEMKHSLAAWLQQTRRTSIPSNKTITVISIHGYEGEGNL